MMTRHRTVLLMGLLTIASASFAVAQTPPSSDSTSPDAASTPHQKDSTSSQTGQPATTDSTAPSAASTPHQQQAVSGNSANESGPAGHKVMKDCMSREKAKNTGASKDDMKKTCTDQMKSSPND